MIKRLSNSFKELNKAEDKRRIRTIERIWIGDTPKIHALNYWYYRYFTNELELYILDTIKFEQTNEVNPKYLCKGCNLENSNSEECKSCQKEKSK